MRESIKSYATKVAASFTVATLVAVPFYLSATPGQTLERPSEELAGHARVVDGDTLEVAGVHVRLEGIDAPEISQSCPSRWWGRWSAGREAANELRRMIGRNRVSCRGHGVDGYGRLLGTCSVKGRDLNREMVKRGFAWAFVKYSHHYVSEEQSARKAGIGIWQRTCEPAWDYRANRWSRSASAAPSGCAIKGNISSRGRRIYHMPWGHWYGRTRIETAKGERWFCNEKEAQDAGWVRSGT